MIRVKFFQKNDAYCMTIRGHAGSAPKGADLICCAASTLAYTAAQAAKNLQARGYVLREPNIKMREGKATIVATPTEEGREKLRYAMLVCQGGMEVLEANYPAYLRIEERLRCNQDRPLTDRKD